jgi:hypothetical protein
MFRPISVFYNRKYEEKNGDNPDYSGVDIYGSIPPFFISIITAAF